MPLDGSQYQPRGFFDELFAARGEARPAAAHVASRFIDDLYHDRQVSRDGGIPEDVISTWPAETRSAAPLGNRSASEAS
jgi:hypothetical protein